MGVSFKNTKLELENILESIDTNSSEDAIESTITKRESAVKLRFHKIEAQCIKIDTDPFSFRHLFTFGYIDAKLVHTIETILKKVGSKKAVENVTRYKHRLCEGVVKEFEFYIKKHKDRPEIKKIYEDELNKYKEHMGLKEENVKEENVKERYTDFERNPVASYTNTHGDNSITIIKTPDTLTQVEAQIDTGMKIPMILERDTEEGFKKEWDDWDALSAEQKMISDKTSIKLRGMSNREFYDKMLPNIGKITEAMDFSEVKNIKDMKAAIFSAIQDEAMSLKVREIIDKFEADVSNIKIDTTKYKDRKDHNNVVAEASIAVLVAATSIVHGTMMVVIQLGIAVAVVAFVTIVLAFILAGLIYGTICAVFGIANISKLHKEIVDKHVFTDILENLKEIGEVVSGDDKKIAEIKSNFLSSIGMTEKEVTQQIKEDYNWDDMEFGLDALNMDYDDDTLDDVDDYDKENVDEESEFYKYAIEKESYNDEEVEALIRRYMKIKDANTFQKIVGMFTDFRAAVRESAKKHGNFFIDTDEKDDEKDDKRMMTKAEAIAVVDATLASKYRMYLLAWEHFRRDSAKTMSFSLLTVIFFTCLTVSGLVLLLPVAAVIGGVASIGNWYAFFRDMKRTRLVIIKEIERIDNTVSRMAKEPEPDKEKMKQLLEIKKALIIQAGYDEKSPKWNKLKDPEVVKKLTEMIDYFGDTLSIDDIRLNIIEADAEDEASDLPEAEEDKPAKDDSPETEDDKGTDDGEDDGEEPEEGSFDEAQQDYLNSDPTEDTGASQFKDGGSEAEENFKLKTCLKNLDVLYDKYDTLKRDLVSSDTYKIVNEDDKNRNKPIMIDLINELSIALDNLKTYIEVGDKTSYPIVAVKLSVHQNVLRVIDSTIADLTSKLNKEALDAIDNDEI